MQPLPTIIVQLIHIAGPLKGEIQEFNDPEIAVGRLSTCQVRFPKDLAIISRKHAAIFREGNRFRLVDESANGTFLNGKSVSEAFLKNGDVIMFAEGGPKVSFLTRVDDNMAASPPPPHQKPLTPEPHALKPPPPPGRPPSSEVTPIPLTGDLPRSGSAPAPQKVKMPLVIQYGPTLQSFNELPITIGTDAGCDFVLKHAAVAARHAQIYFDNDQYCIKDLTGQQSISIHGAPIHTGTALRPEDVLALGNNGPAFRFLGGGRLAEIEQPDSALAAEPDGMHKKAAPAGEADTKKAKKAGSIFSKFFSK